MKYVRFAEGVGLIGPGEVPKWGVANEETMPDSRTGTRFGIDVWQVFWADGSQGRYAGHELVILGDVPAPLESSTGGVHIG